MKKTFYIFHKKLCLEFTPIHAYEHLQVGKMDAMTFANFFQYWVYKVERDSISSDQKIILNPEKDEVAFFNIFDETKNRPFQTLQLYPELQSSTNHMIQTSQPRSQNPQQLYHYFSVTPATVTPTQQTLIEHLYKFLSADFFSKTTSDKWQEVYKLRLKYAYMDLLLTDPPFSYVFLQNMANEAGIAAITELKNSITFSLLLPSTLSANSNNNATAKMSTTFN